MDVVKKLRVCYLVVVLILNLKPVFTSQEVMKKMTVGFANVLQGCSTELSAGDHIMQDFYNYWREDYELLNRDFGCMVLCMASKLDLINTEDATLHHGNAAEFAKKHGADEGMAKQLVTMLHECEKAGSEIRDECLLALDIAKCFRTKIHELKWAPNMEVVIEEVLSELSN